MPIKIGSLQGEKRPLTVPYNDDEVNLHYWPAVYTADYEDRVLSLTQTERNAGALALMLFELIADWDVTEDDGTPYALTLENLRIVPGTFLSPLFEAIMEDARKHNPNQMAINRRARRVSVSRNGR